MISKEHLNQLRLPELARFPETRGIAPGESFDLHLVATSQPIVLFVSTDNILAARKYRNIIGKDQRDFAILSVENPIQEATQLRESDVIPLVMHSATDPVLFQRMFADGPRFGQLLMGHIYNPTIGHQSPSVHVVGVATQGLEILSELAAQPDDSIAQKMATRRREILGSTIVSNEDFRRTLQSPSVHKIIAHALGPTGTNISQAMELYIRTHGLEGKTELIVHPAGIEPMAYAEMAMEEVEEGVVPIHMECAVYYDEEKLFNLRKSEVVLADHQYMDLDTMQLASIKELEELAASGVMRIATHTSPAPLVDRWVDASRAQWLKATSNAAAAQMVMSGEADACVTTASSLDQEQARNQGLVSRHVFGSPVMFFTIATPLSQEQLRYYLQ